MSFKSKKQFEKMQELEKQGKVKAGTTKKWANETPDMHKLPERKTPPKPQRAPSAPKAPRTLEDLRKIEKAKFGK